MISANDSKGLGTLWIKSDPSVRSFRHAVKCSFCGEEHNVWSCTQKHARSSCLSLEEHLLACMFADDQDQDQETGFVCQHAAFTPYLLILDFTFLIFM